MFQSVIDVNFFIIDGQGASFYAAFLKDRKNLSKLNKEFQEI